MVKAGYKQTEIGEIPEDWSVFCFRDHFSVFAGGDAPKHSLSSVQTEKHPYPIYANAIQNRGLYGYTGESRSEGDVVTITARGYIGHAEYRSGAFFPIVRLLVMEPIRGLDAKFSAYSINDRIEFAIESTGVPQLTAPQVRTYSIAAPQDKNEQKTIADALSDVDGLIEALEKQIAKKRDIKTATMQQLLTGKKRLPDFGEGKGWKQSKFGRIPEGWERVNVGEDATLNARIGWQALTTKEYEDAGEYFLVTGTDFIGGRVNWDTCHYVSKWRYSQDKKIQLMNGDVLITKDGTIGKAGFVEGLSLPAALNSGVFVIRPAEERFFPKFLYYILTSRVFDEFLSKITAGSTITHLYQKDFVHFDFYAPEPKEQEAIASVLGALDTEFEKLKTKLTKTKAIKQGMMQELLTGRTRLV